MDQLLASWPPETLALVAFAFFAAGIVKGTLGLGLPIVVIAIVAPSLGLQLAIGLIILPSIAMNLWQAVVGGGFFELLHRLWSLMAMAGVGIWVGVQILAAADQGLLLTFLAVLLIVYSGWSLARAELRPPKRLEVIISPIVGFLAGLIFGMVGNFMVPGVVYLQALNMGRDRLVQALGMSFVVISVTLLVIMSRYALVDSTTLLVSAGAMLPGLVSMAIGQRVRRHLGEAQFRFLFFVALIVTGIYMLVRAQLA